jgi:hypothetical protein
LCAVLNSVRFWSNEANKISEIKQENGINPRTFLIWLIAKTDYKESSHYCCGLISVSSHMGGHPIREYTPVQT